MADLRPTVALVDREAFRHNLRTARRLSGDAAVMAVIKADGYGHGAVPLAAVAAEEGCPLLGVATVPEALALRGAGVDTDILVLGGFPPGSEEAALGAGLQAVLFDLPSAERLEAAGAATGKRVPVHLKLDTGMGRLGFLPGDWGEAFRRVASLSRVEVVGAMTHYARADEEDPGPTLRQAALFGQGLEAVHEAGLRPRWFHARNSAAILLGRGATHNLVRPGIMLYGALPTASGEPGEHGLRPVMTLRTALAQVRTLPAGWAVSYGGLWTAPGPRRVGVLPIGYADGFLRYNRRGDVLIRGRRVPVVGTVCMDMAMVDLAAAGGGQPGEEVVIIGRQGDEGITAGEVARRGGTIPYEVFCGVSARVVRRYGEAGS